MVYHGLVHHGYSKKPAGTGVVYEKKTHGITMAFLTPIPSGYLTQCRLSTWYSMSWIQASKLGHASDVVTDSHSFHPNKPGPNYLPSHSFPLVLMLFFHCSTLQDPSLTLPPLSDTLGIATKREILSHPCSSDEYPDHLNHQILIPASDFTSFP